MSISFVSADWVQKQTVNVIVNELTNESLQMNWTGLKNYPSGCGAGEAVQVIGDTLTCISVGGGGGGSQWNIDDVYLNNVSDVLTFNESKLNNTIDNRVTAAQNPFDQVLNTTSNVTFNSLIFNDADNIESNYIVINKNKSVGGYEKVFMINDTNKNIDMGFLMGTYEYYMYGGGDTLVGMASYDAGLGTDGFWFYGDTTGAYYDMYDATHDLHFDGYGTDNEILINDVQLGVGVASVADDFAVSGTSTLKLLCVDTPGSVCTAGTGQILATSMIASDYVNATNDMCLSDGTCLSTAGGAFASSGGITYLNNNDDNVTIGNDSVNYGKITVIGDQWSSSSQKHIEVQSFKGLTNAQTGTYAPPANGIISLEYFNNNVNPAGLVKRVYQPNEESFAALYTIFGVYDNTAPSSGTEPVMAIRGSTSSGGTLVSGTALLNLYESPTDNSPEITFQAGPKIGVDTQIPVNMFEVNGESMQEGICVNTLGGSCSVLDDELVIGKSSADTNLDVYDGTNDNVINIKSGDDRVSISMQDPTTTGIGYVEIGADDNDMFFETNNIENMRLYANGSLSVVGQVCDVNGCIGSGGGTSYWELNGINVSLVNNSHNVGIGLSNPTQKLEVVGSALIQGDISSTNGGRFLGGANPISDWGASELHNMYLERSDETTNTYFESGDFILDSSGFNYYSGTYTYGELDFGAEFSIDYQPSVGSLNQIYFKNTDTNLGFEIQSSAEKVAVFDPSASIDTTNTPYIFDTIDTLTTGNHTVWENNDTRLMTLDYNGNLGIGSRNYGKLTMSNITQSNPGSVTYPSEVQHFTGLTNAQTGAYAPPGQGVVMLEYFNNARNPAGFTRRVYQPNEESFAALYTVEGIYDNSAPSTGTEPIMAIRGAKYDGTNLADGTAMLNIYETISDNSADITFQVGPRVGIGISNPPNELDINGVMATEGACIFPTVGSTCSATGDELGIGILNPGFNLHVYDASNNYLAHFDSDDDLSYITFADPGTTSTVHVGIGADDNDLSFRSGNAENMVLDSNGNLGIGTDTPQSELDVYDASSPVIRSICDGADCLADLAISNDAQNWSVRLAGGDSDNFQIRDLTSATAPLKIEVGTPTNTLKLESDGRLFTTPLATAPATCIIGHSYVDTSGAYCACTSTNTWENMVSTGTCA